MTRIFSPRFISTFIPVIYTSFVKAVNMSNIGNRRGGHKSQVKKLTGYVESELSLSNPDLVNLSEWKSELVRQRDIILDCDDKVLGTLTEEDTISTEICNSSDFHIYINKTIRHIDVVLDNNARNARNKSEVMTSVKLPYIQLVKFSGDSLQWPKFWDLFRSSIHDRKDLSGATKFHYLVTQLQGEAEQLLTGFDHTDAEYEEAVKLLSETYGKPQRIIQARLHGIFDLENPKGNAADLGKFRSLYEGHLRGLKSLGANVDSAGYVFAELLIRKLPVKVRDNLNRAHKSDFWNLDDLRKEIDIEIGHLQSVEPRTGNDLEFDLPASTCSFKATNFEPNCPFCNSKHFPINCIKYDTVDSRRSCIFEKKLCFNCLKGNHSVRVCNNSGRCRNCQGKHHTSICNSKFSGDRSKVNEVITVESEYSEAPPSALNAITSLSARNRSDGVTNILPTAILSIVIGNSNVNAKAILDSGSQRTFILRSFVTQFGVPIIDNISLTIDGFNSLGKARYYDVTEFNIKVNDGLMKISAVVIDSLPNRISMPGRGKVVDDLRAEGYNLADPTNDSDNLTDIGLLVGIDYFFALLGAQTCKGVHVLPSKVGAIIGGTIQNNSSAGSFFTAVLGVGTQVTDTLDEKLQKFWQMDSVNLDTKDDELLAAFEDSITFNNERYTVALPWKTGHPDLPKNYHYAKSRLDSVLKKLRNNQKNLQCYNSIINEQLKLGFIEEVADVFADSDNIHYLAHRAVERESGTTPLRVVYDCSAKPNKNKPSLNECLYAGPNLINDLSSILLRFRVGKFAATSDIKKAFLCVGLKENDRDATRFLWPSDPFDPDSQLKTYRFRSVLFGGISSPFLLNATLKFHFKRHDEHLGRELEHNIYVDNIYLTSNSEADLREKKGKTISLLGKGGFSLHEWSSNSALIGDASTSDDSGCSILGLRWDFLDDNIAVNKVDLTISEILTKRNIVSGVASVFDPLGFLLPVTLQGRLLIQVLWKLKLGWDEQIPENIANDWSAYVGYLGAVSSLVFSRCVTSEESVDLHVFADASTKAYGAVAYLKCSSSVNFVIAKCKLAPVNGRTLPQLELCALVLAVDLSNFVKKSYERCMNIKSVTIWTDSSIVLHWLKSEKFKSQFVKNRVTCIKSRSCDVQFNYVDTASNPADLVTRGLTARYFISKLSFWIHGPIWLLTEQWPVPPLSLSASDVRVSCIEDLEQISVNCVTRDSVNIFPIEKFSTYRKAVKVLGYVRRFIKNCRLPVTERDFTRNLSPNEAQKAERVLIKLAQRQFYSDIFAYFNCQRKIKCPPLISNLRLFITDGLLLCGGRIHNSDVQENTKFPILLPQKSHLSKLIIQSIHDEFHFGVSHVLSTLRQRYWLPQGRQNIKSIIRKCVHCKKLQGRPFPKTDVPPLPKLRVSETQPFAVTGVDYTGALQAKDGENFRKYYVCLFTCAVTRAVHLELVEDLTSESFIRALRRFSGRRSYPNLIISDNATNFTHGDKMLHEILRSNVVNNYFLHHRIKWQFITPSAPWMGGMYERLIGTTKLCLKKVLGRSVVTYHELHTVLIQTEAVINDRPLTYASDDPEELQSLTPSMLLCGHRIYNLPECLDFEELYDETFNAKSAITKRMLYCSKLFRDFSERWRKEYLVSLREKERSLMNSSNVKATIGQIVQLYDDGPRQFWKLGCIVRLYEGNDGIVRSADIRTKSGVFMRPLVRLFPLELDIEDNQTHALTKTELKSPRPVREAALEARRKIKSIVS